MTLFRGALMKFLDKSSQSDFQPFQPALPILVQYEVIEGVMPQANNVLTVNVTELRVEC